MEKHYFGPRSGAKTAIFGELIQPKDGVDEQVFSVPADNDAGEVNIRITQSNIHLVIDLGARAQVMLFIEYAVEDAQNCALEILLAEESSLTCTFLVPSHTQNVRIEQKSRLATGAHLQWQNVTLSAGTVQHSADSHITGHDATSDIDWIFYARDKEQYTLTATNTFDAQNGGGEITIQGVAEHTAHVLCNGLINIGLGGKGTDTYLTESVLMLDPTAKVDAIPGLEIKTNDVKASHSATVSRVTAEDLYYFAARGIPTEEARQMFIVGFLGGRLEKIVNTSIQESIQHAFMQKYSPDTVLAI